MQNVCTCFHYLMVNADSRHSSLARRPLKQQSQFYVSCYVLIVLSLFSAAFRPFVSELKYAKCSKHCQSVSSVMSFAWSENACQLNIGRIMIFFTVHGVSVHIAVFFTYYKCTYVFTGTALRLLISHVVHALSMIS